MPDSWYEVNRTTSNFSVQPKARPDVRQVNIYFAFCLGTGREGRSPCGGCSPWIRHVYHWIECKHSNHNQQTYACRRTPIARNSGLWFRFRNLTLFPGHRDWSIFRTYTRPTRDVYGLRLLCGRPYLTTRTLFLDHFYLGLGALNSTVTRDNNKKNSKAMEPKKNAVVLCAMRTRTRGNVSISLPLRRRKT